MLEFEHIIQVNDPAERQIRPMSRDELWQGLLLRARDPGRFNGALTCRVDDESHDSFTRYVKAGDTQFRERVTLTRRERIETVTAGADQPLFAASITTIEETAAGCLFVRFIYRRDLEDSAEGRMIGEHLKSAYLQVDIDAIALIRMLAEDELLHKLPN